MTSSSSSSAAPAPLLLKSIRIWPIGDSITAGASNNWEKWSEENGGYRRNLMLLLNEGYAYKTVGGTTANAPGGSLPASHSGYSGEGLSVFSKPEFTPSMIKQNAPDAVLVMLGINSIGSKQEYPDTQGQYWSTNGHNFNGFFIQYKAFIDKMLANTTSAKVFIAKIPPIGDTRFYQTTWDDSSAPSPTGWTTVGDGSVNPKNVVAEFNTELQAMYDAYYSSEPRVIVVDLNTGLTVGGAWEDDINVLGVPQQWWNGDGLHPTYYGYRHIAERWEAAIRAAIPPLGQPTVLYSVDCGTKEGTTSMKSEGAIVGSQQSVVWDKPYGPDASTGKNWGHMGVAGYSGNAPSNRTMWFAWEGDSSVSKSIASAEPGNDLVYRFEVPANATYRVFLGFHDSWADSSQSSTRKAEIYIDGNLVGNKNYKYKDYGRSIYEVKNTTGTLEVKVHGTSDNALLDSIVIQRVQ